MCIVSMMRLGMLQFRGISIIQEEVQVIQKRLSSYMSSKRSIKQVFSPLPKQPREGSVQRIWRKRGAGIHRRRGSKETREKPAYTEYCQCFASISQHCLCTILRKRRRWYPWSVQGQEAHPTYKSHDEGQKKFVNGFTHTVRTSRKG